VSSGNREGSGRRNPESRSRWTGSRRLSERVAFVTGASRGIGEAIARRFASEGARVALAARNEAACGKIAGDIRRQHGVIGLTRTFALELATRQITVNALVPGWVETEMAREGFRRLGEQTGGGEEEGRRMAAKMAPLGRVLAPEEVAGLAAYLASDEARSITGQAITIDGGQVMP